MALKTVNENLLSRLAGESAVLVSVVATRGSVPREVGAWMAVFDQDTLGTIGGGHLELQSIQKARSYLRETVIQDTHLYKLGPSLGQCCGGEVQLHYEIVTANELATLEQRLQVETTAVALFGSGHVGKALVRVLGSLPVKVNWIDSRDEIFPDHLPINVRCEHSDPVEAAVDSLEPNSRILIMSFSHAEDLNVVSSCLLRQRTRADLPFIGLIGSQTKWATFRSRLIERGFSAQEISHVTCPIGVPGISGKQPEVIAVAVAAQIMQIRKGN
ncbi:MAG: xanthine dehydrogenase accessory protein XdhC [Burkholderiaceae bacterium]